MEEQIYDTPENYDLEHSQAEPDVQFYRDFVKRLKPRRVLELGCGNGRLSFPVARELAVFGGHLTGIDTSQAMLTAAREKGARSSSRADRDISWVMGDIRSWRGEAFDLVFCPCSSMSHLLTLEDHLAAWRTAFANVAPGGRFLVAETMANLSTLAESQHVPPRVVLEIDNDTVRQTAGRVERLIRFRATSYEAHEQRALVRFLYDKVDGAASVAERFLSDYESHVFFPRELMLLFLMAGFRIESTWGDYSYEPLGNHSRQIIMVGAKD